MNAAQEALVATVIEHIEAGTPPWVRPWSVSGYSSLPSNLATARPYSGANIIQLWIMQSVLGFPTAQWCTFVQARSLGATVRKGEHGTTVWFTKTGVARNAFDSDDAPSPELDRPYRVLKQFTVFNRAQLDGLPPIAEPALRDHEPIHHVEALLARQHSSVTFGGDVAYYDRRRDVIACPERGRFRDAGSYYATLLHEHAHWTGHTSRLARAYGKRFGDQAYAFEELVAELTSAFACADLGVGGRLQHTEYLANRAEVFRNDPMELWAAGSHASRAYACLAGAEAVSKTAA